MTVASAAWGAAVPLLFLLAPGVIAIMLIRERNRNRR